MGRLLFGLWVLFFIVPTIASTQHRRVVDQGVLYPTEYVFLNGVELDSLRTTTTGDVIMTKDHGSASLHSLHSVTLIAASSVVQVGQAVLALEVGTLSTSVGNEVKPVIPDDLGKLVGPGPAEVDARDVRVLPSSQSLTEFDVTRSNGLISISARKNGVEVRCGSQKFVIQQGRNLVFFDQPGCRSHP